jgi:leader peptidase (prepilin peptidase)/N-methyltransferase
MSFAALIGLAAAMLLMHFGFIQPSFIDVSERAVEEPAKQKLKGPKAAISVAITSAHGVNPRKEILREVLFLAPAIVLAAAAHVLVTHVPGIHNAWVALLRSVEPHSFGAAAAVFGYLVGGALIWGTRILGTLAFGKEAMGLGDVHILAAVGAVTGPIVPTIAFFVAPFLGLLWAVYLLISRGQRELPYGPWLAAASVLVMLGYDLFGDLIHHYAALGQLLR